MPVDERCKRGFGIFAAALEEPLEQLSVGQAGGGAGAKEGLDLLDEFHRGPSGQASYSFGTTQTFSVSVRRAVWHSRGAGFSRAPAVPSDTRSAESGQLEPCSSTG